MASLLRNYTRFHSSRIALLPGRPPRPSLAHPTKHRQYLVVSTDSHRPSCPILAVRDDTHCVRRTHVDGRRRDPTISQLCRIRVGCLLTYSVGPVYYLVNTLLNVVAWQGSSFNTFACWICTLFYVHIYLL